MAIIITGGAGYIGAQTVYSFVDAGHDVIVVDSLSSGRQPNLPSSVPVHKGNLHDHDLMEDIFAKNKIDTVIHIAGSTVVSESVANPLKYYFNNTESTRLMLELCLKHKVKNFIFSSTAAVYGNNPLRLMKEVYPPAPETPYAASKLMAERMIEDVSAAEDLNYVILRYFNVAGADPAMRTGQVAKNATHLVKLVVEAATGQRERVKVYGTDYDTKDGSGVRDYIHVADVADAHLKTYEFMKKGGGKKIFNVGYGEGYSVLEIIRAVEKISGKKLMVDFEPRRAGDIGALTGDSTELQINTGWAPQYNNLDTIIETALEWEKRQL